MLNPLESSLLRSVAFDSTNARFIVSPQAGRLRDWVQTPLAKRIFQAIGELALHQKPVNPLAISISAHLNSQELTYLLSEWQSGKATTPADLEQTVTAIRNQYLVQASHFAMDECKKKNLQAPEFVVRNLGELGAELEILAHEGFAYDPHPSSHKDDPSFALSGTWGNKTFDDMFDGGLPTRGYSLVIGPSGHGKSSLGRSQAAFLVAHQIPTLMCVNEDLIDAGYTSKQVHRALTTMWAGQRDEDEIWRDMDTYLKIYDLDAGTHDIHQIDRFAYWEQPQVLILDSLDNLNFPKEADKYHDDNAKHRIRANYLASMTKDRGCFTTVVGNGSKAEQAEIKKDIMKVGEAMAFSSIWYFNMSSWSFVFCRDKTTAGVADVKRLKNRGRTGSIGELFYLSYNSQGGYYDQLNRPLP